MGSNRARGGLARGGFTAISRVTQLLTQVDGKREIIPHGRMNCAHFHENVQGRCMCVSGSSSVPSSRSPTRTTICAFDRTRTSTAPPQVRRTVRAHALRPHSREFDARRSVARVVVNATVHHQRGRRASVRALLNCVRMPTPVRTLRDTAQGADRRRSRRCSVPRSCFCSHFVPDAH